MKNTIKEYRANTHRQRKIDKQKDHIQLQKNEFGERSYIWHPLKSLTFGIRSPLPSIHKHPILV